MLIGACDPMACPIHNAFRATAAAVAEEPIGVEEPPQYMTMMPPSPSEAPQYMSMVPVSPSEVDNRDAHRGLALLSRLIGIQHASKESDGFRLSLSFDHGSDAGHRGSGGRRPTQGTAAAAAASAGTRRGTSNAPSSTVTHSGHRQSQAMQDLMADFSIDTAAASLGEDTDDLMDLLDLAT